MSLDLTQIVELSPSGLTFITSDDINNSAFALPTLLSAKVKEIRSLGPLGAHLPVIVLVTLNQSYTHFASVLARSFGLNLNTYRDSGKLVSIDLLKNLNEFTKDGHFSFDLLRNVILSAVNSLPATPSVANLIVLDDISLLYSTLSVNYADVYHFILQIWSVLTQKWCHLIIQSHLLTLIEDLSSLNKLAELTEGDSSEESALRVAERKIVFSLSSLATNWLNFAKLQTGYSAQYNGSFVCLSKKVDKECQSVTQVESKRYLYKCQERNTKIFLPGLN